MKGDRRGRRSLKAHHTSPGVAVPPQPLAGERARDEAFAEREGLKVQDLYAAQPALKRKGVFGEEKGSQPRFARVKVDSAIGIGSGCLPGALANGCLVELSCRAEPEAWRAPPQPGVSD